MIVLRFPNMFASRLSLALVAAAMVAAPAAAQRNAAAGPRPILSATDGRFLAGTCASRDPGNRSFCYGYIFGIADEMVLQGLMCRPGTLNGDQLVTLVRSHLASSPNDLPLHASILVRRVLAANNPCRR
jgi:hypothetical protein